MSDYSFQAVVFDLDGVVTQTARVHFEAWKAMFDEYLRLREKRDKEPFREFTHQDDYLPYVDGKPRYQGVKSFLESRKINIAYGDPQDKPDKETICGLGNRKNIHFREIIKEKGAEVYESTVRFINDLKDAGIEVGVATSSKNCSFILQSSGLGALFKVRVDGVESAKLGLKGKPEADIFVEAAHRLQKSPAESVVVEDAVSGVQAGRNGGFGLVLGVARKNNTADLLANGADVAVEDISGINIQWIENWFLKKPRHLFESWQKTVNEKDVIDEPKKKACNLVINPSYLRNPESVFSHRKKLVFFLDYDGTLTPIVKRPELAVLSEDMRRVIKKLSKTCTTAIVSGRMRQDVEKLVAIENLIYAGSHGFDIKGPNITMIEPNAEKTIPLVTKIIEELKEGLGSIEGLLIEEKKFSAAVHYRLVSEQYLSKIKTFVEDIIKKNPSLRLMYGKKVFEILPAIDWDKGKAIRWLMQALGISWERVQVVYIGDDTTDEDAFRMIRTRGTGILVANSQKPSAADFQLSSPSEVKSLFEKFLN